MKDEILDLLRTFINREISAPDFEKRYLDQWRKLRDLRWQNANCDFSDDQLRILDQIFTAVDSYCSDDKMRGEGDLDDKGLLAEVTTYARELGINSS